MSNTLNSHLAGENQNETEMRQQMPKYCFEIKYITVLNCKVGNSNKSNHNQIK